MAVSWLNALENLQGQYSGLPEVEKLFEKDFQWVDEILAEATTLFRKDTTQEVSETTNENDDPNALGVAPVLLPQTPGVSVDIIRVNYVSTFHIKKWYRFVLCNFFAIFMKD